MPSAIVTMTLNNAVTGAPIAGAKILSSVANTGRVPVEVPTTADGSGVISLELSNSDSFVYKIQLPDGQFGYLPVRSTDTTIALGTQLVYPQGVLPPNQDITSLWASTIQATALALKQDKAWTVVSSASASVSPVAADSGKYYRLSNANPTFNLPTTSLVVCETEFWLTLTGSPSATGTVDAGTGKTVDKTISDGAGGFTGGATQTAGNIVPFRLYHIKYVATDVWASDIMTVA